MADAVVDENGDGSLGPFSEASEPQGIYMGIAWIHSMNRPALESAFAAVESGFAAFFAGFKGKTRA